MSGKSATSIAVIGFSEAGQAFAAGLRRAGADVRVYDVRLLDGADRAALLDAARASDVAAAEDMEQAVDGAEIVLSAVTAASASAVAREAAPILGPGSIFLDLNSISPKQKTVGAAHVDAGHGAYVEGAIMSPVAPHGHAVPILAGGARAHDVAAALGALGMSITVAGAEIGTASAVKMCRSIVMKGIEAIVLEALVTASRFGVIEEVVASLAHSYPGIDWPQRSAYVIGRVIKHGHRRVEEMQEAAVTVREAGLEPIMAEAIAARLAWSAGLAIGDFPQGGDYRDMVEAVSEAARLE